LEQNVTPLERAFQIARSGKANTTNDIRKALKAEGYSEESLKGPYLYKQLRVLMRLSAGKKTLDAEQV
jgi:hypothetical protein